MKPPLPKLPRKAKAKAKTNTKTKSTAQQGQDFTAEGAPPPGRVGLCPPVEATEPVSIKDQAATEKTPAGCASAGPAPQ